MSIKKYISELKRRNVFKAGIAYLLIAWLIVQVASIVLPTFNAPPYIMKSLLFIMGIGFPIYLIFSWIYDITPEGIKKTKEIDEKSQELISKNNRLNKVIIASLSLAVILLLFNQFMNNSSNKKDPHYDDNKTIAVLPLKNLNQNEQLEYFSDGVTQEIIDQLAKIHQFNLSAFSSTVIYKKSDKNLKEIAAELGVELILSGSSRIYGDSVRLSIELVNPQSNSRIWNDQYNDILSNAIKIQTDIAQQVAEELNIQLSPHETANINKINTNNYVAFDLFLKARSEYVQLTKKGFKKSIEMLERALELDPDYAQAYTLLAWVHLLNGSSEIVSDAENSQSTVEKARPLIEKAISLDPENSDNYLIMGNMNLFYLNDLPEAVQNVNKALSMNSWPKVPTNYCICSAVAAYIAMGNFERATEMVKLSKKIDPSNVFVFIDEGIILLLKGNNVQAIYSFKQAVEYLDIPSFNFYIGWAYYHLREYENALIYLDNAITGEEEPMSYALAFLSNTHFKMGNTKMGNQYRDMLLKKQYLGRANLNIPLAMISAGRGKTEEALILLEKAHKEKDFGFAHYLNFDPVFDKLRSNNRFIGLIRNPGF